MFIQKQTLLKPKCCSFLCLASQVLMACVKFFVKLCKGLQQEKKNLSLNVTWCNSRFPCFVGSINCGSVTHAESTRPCGLTLQLSLGSVGRDAGALSVPPGSWFCPELMVLKQGGCLIFVMAGQSRWLLLFVQALLAISRCCANSLHSAGGWFEWSLGYFKAAGFTSPILISSTDFSLSLNKKLPVFACRACCFFVLFLSIRLLSSKQQGMRK